MYVLDSVFELDVSVMEWRFSNGSLSETNTWLLFVGFVKIK